MVTVQFVGGSLRDVIQILESCGAKEVKIHHARCQGKTFYIDIEIEQEVKQRLDILNQYT